VSSLQDAFEERDDGCVAVTCVTGGGVATIHYLFTALHGMQTRSNDENSVRLSVCLSHACIVTKR